MIRSLLLSLGLAAVLAPAAGPPEAGCCRSVKFREQVIATGLKYGEALAVADLNGDGKPDLIAVDQRATELAWYENPSWTRHVMASGVPRPISVDCADIDGDGTPEVALVYGFDSSPQASAGIVAVLHHDGDVRRPWTLREIDRVPTAHRVRWVDLEGNGRRVLMMAPLVGAGAAPPLYIAPVGIYLYRPPEFKREIVQHLAGVVHSLYPVDFDGDGRQEVLTASFRGLRLLSPSGGNEGWSSQEISRGTGEACPRCGSSEVVLGHVKKRRFLAAIEPWHGNHLALYMGDQGGWERFDLDASLEDGHALAAGDLDGDGRDEIVAGYRGRGGRVKLYKAEDADGLIWAWDTLDAAMPAADCRIVDLDGDGRPDIVCLGASTGNLKWYQNLGKAK